MFPFFYIVTLTKQLLELGCMRVRYNDINNERFLLYISPLTAETGSEENPIGRAGLKLAASRV
jgi:hypothetical protein